MSEAIRFNEENPLQMVATAAVAAGEILQLPDGWAAYYPGLSAMAIGDILALETEGLITVPKTASINILDGGKVFWDAANSKAHFKLVNGGFYLGRAVGDSLASATTVVVNLNVDPLAFIDLKRSTFETVLVNGGLCVCEPGGTARLNLAATNEAEKSDLLSNLGVTVGRKGIMECRVAMTAAAANTDINIGMANGTHASDAESISEFCGFHMDGGALTINAQSRDGTTTVAVVDTTNVFVAATFIEFWIDFRDNTDIQLYVDGVNVLPSSVFKMNAAAGPLKALVHAEKSSSTDTAIVRVEVLRVRTFD